MLTTRRRIERVLVVEDNAPLRSAISRFARGWGAEVVEAGTAREAKLLLSPPADLIIIDVRLPDAPAFEVLESASHLWPAPVKVVISGEASPAEAFRLGQLGVRAYLAKPFSLGDLEAAVETACSQTAELAPLLSDSVGKVPFREFMADVRGVMIHQALALSRGNVTAAARLLQVSRQAVQQILRARRPHAHSDAGAQVLGDRGRESKPLA